MQYRHPRYRKAARGAGVLLTCLLVTGCSLFKLSHTAPPPAPAPVQISERQLEFERRVLRFGEDVASLVVVKGAEPRAPLVEQARNAIRIGRARLGDPAKAVAVPVDTGMRSKEAAAAERALTKELQRYRQTEADWKREYELYRGTPVKTGWSLSMPILWGIPLWGLIVAVIVILVPGAGGLLVKALFRARKALSQIVKANQQWMQTAQAEQAESLKAALRAEMADEKSKALVRKIKSKQLATELRKNGGP